MTKRAECCQLCGGLADLQSHHLNINRQNGMAVNLVTVCQRCHSLIHHHMGVMGRDEFMALAEKAKIAAPDRFTLPLFAGGAATPIDKVLRSKTIEVRNPRSKGDGLASYKINIDGAARPPSGGDMGIGISAKTFSVSRHVGQGTSNAAEFIALETAIDEARARGITDELVIHTDSKLVYHQARGDWKVKSDTSKKYVPRIRKKMDAVILVWVPREKNKAADRLATKALDGMG